MDGDNTLRAECQESARKSFRPSEWQVSFTASTFRLQRASDRQNAAIPGKQSLFLDQVSTQEARRPPRIAAGRFCLLNESTTRPSTAKQQGLPKSSVSASKKGAREEFAMTYSLSGSQQDQGVVPLITVGSVFTLIRKRCGFSPRKRSRCSWHRTGYLQKPMYS